MSEQEGTAKLLGLLVGVVCIAGIIAGTVSGTAVGQLMETKTAPEPVKVITLLCHRPNSDKTDRYTVGEDGVTRIRWYNTYAYIEREPTPEVIERQMPVKMMLPHSLYSCAYAEKWIIPHKE